MPDVLTELTGTGAANGADGFAAMLAMLDPEGVEPTAPPVEVDVDGEAGDDGAEPPALTTLAVETLAILARAATPTVVAASSDGAAVEAASAPASADGLAVSVPRAAGAPTHCTAGVPVPAAPAAASALAEAALDEPEISTQSPDLRARAAALPHAASDLSSDDVPLASQPPTTTQVARPGVVERSTAAPAIPVRVDALPEPTEHRTDASTAAEPADAPTPAPLVRDPAAPVPAEAAEPAIVSTPRSPRPAARVEGPSVPADDSAHGETADAPVVAVGGAAPAADQPSGEAAEPRTETAGGHAVRRGEASPRATDAAPLEGAPEPPVAKPAGATSVAVAEPAATVMVRRREPARLPADPPPDLRHVTTADVSPRAARQAAAPPAPASDATAAYRSAEALVRSETPRPLGRLADGGEMRLEVAPEGLGPIEIRVAVRADAVQASLWTQQDHARAALEAHRPMLADALERSSLRLEGFTVGLGQHQQASHEDERTPRRWEAPAGAEPVAPATPTLAPVRTRGLSLRA